MRIARVLLVALVGAGLSAAAKAQATDSLRVGDRIRIRGTGIRKESTLFVGTLIGSVRAISPDTLTVAVAGERSVVLPRVAIEHVDVSDGHQSRLNILPIMVPMALTTGMSFTLANRPGLSGWRRGERYALSATGTYLLLRTIMRTPPERWRPLSSWLDR